MDNIELYINGTLCDTGKNFGVRLKRQLISPAELNTKDAQASYSVTLPVSRTNDRVFNYSSIEESKGKFNRLNVAELIINSHRVFKGNFRLSEINKNGYVGHLVVPVAKTVKDVFGESKLTDNAPLEVTFKDFTEYINYWNSEAKNGELPPCIFPYVLYGVIPKMSSSPDGNIYTARDLWDSSVVINMGDLPPSINVLQMLKHIFKGRDYTLTGSAFDDIRLNSLYVSYKNETEYVQPWNYGRQAYVKIKGNWSNTRVSFVPPFLYNFKFEKNGNKIVNDNNTYFSSDILNSTNANIEILENPGANIIMLDMDDKNSNTWKTRQIMIPLSGYYKIRLKSNLTVNSNYSGRTNPYGDGETGLSFLFGRSDDDNNKLGKRRFEIMLLRDWKTGNFNIPNMKVDKEYFRDNLNQTDTNAEGTIKYYPRPQTLANGLKSEIMFIDPAQNPNCVLGLSWGFKNNKFNPSLSNQDRFSFGTILAAKTGFSWDVKVNSNKPSKVAIPSPGYLKYGVLGEFGDEESNPNIDIDFSKSQKEHDKGLDDSGRLTELGEGQTSLILYRFLLTPKSSYSLEIPSQLEYKQKIFIHDSITEDSAPLSVLEFNDIGKLSYETPEQITYLTMYLALDSETVSFDVSEGLRINRTFAQGEDVIGWEDSNKFRIELNNAPNSHCQNTGDWTGEGEANAIVWFEKGEILTLASVSDEGRHEADWHGGRYGWVIHDLDFELDISPFRVDEDWIKVNTSGNGTKTMNWNDPTNFQTDYIDLVKFLPNDVRTDEFIDNFCKAFNLKLYQTDSKDFVLDVKQSKRAQQNNFVDLDALASVKDKANQPLGLPSAYSIGFTVNEDEEGYVKSGDNGGGSFSTGAIEGGVTEQKSNFSFNWFKNIRKAESGGKIVNILLPVISKAEVWTSDLTYPEAMSKRYTSLAQRFWYFDGLLNDLGVSFKFGQSGKALQLAKVSNALPGLNTLSYKDENNTILDNYFSLLTDADSHYTVIECYLRPDQYEDIGNGAKVRFNGDMYYVADLDGYDPLNKNKCKIKLIRLI